MSEYRVEFNSLVQNIKYQLETFSGAVADVAAGNVSNKGAIATGLDAGATTLKAVTDSAIGQGIGEATGMKLVNGRYKFENSATFGVSLPKYLEPYRNLYGVQATGFEYYMPYFHTDWKQIKSSWGDTEGGIPMITNLADKEGVFKTFTNAAMMDQNTLGAYVERPQMFQYSGENTPTLQFSVVLSNTNDEDDIIRNWHLAFMLAYQNLANKSSKIFLEPPVIYEIEVPGQTYFPYAYIDSLAIVNRGATRVMKIPYYNITSESEPASIDTQKNAHRDQSRWDTYSSDKMARNTVADGLWKRIVASEKLDKLNKIKTVEAIIPDAFEITISIKSLLPETKNLLFHSTLGSGTLGKGIYTAHVPNP